MNGTILGIIILLMGLVGCGLIGSLFVRRDSDE
jgi:hypothetical protein